MATATKLNANRDASDLAEQVETLRNDLSALTQTIADLGKQKGEHTIDAAKEKAADVRDRAVDQAEAARCQAMELQGQANDFVRNQPAAALGIAAGIGFLVGFMGTRK